MSDPTRPRITSDGEQVQREGEAGRKARAVIEAAVSGHPTRTPDGRWYGEPTLRPDQIVPFLRSVTASGETLHEADFACISAALSTTPAPLDAAWAAAEAALPEGWMFGVNDHGEPSAYNPAPGQPFGQERYDAWAKLGISSAPAGCRGRGPTPAAALLALAEKLREYAKP